MPDLDQLLDTLVSDVSERTRAPGAPAAIKQAHRRRTKVAATTLAAVALIAVGTSLGAATLDGPDRPSPIGEPTTPSPTTAQESPEPPRTPANLIAELYPVLAQVPGWTNIDVDDPVFKDRDYAFNGDCAGNWGKGATGGHDGGIGGLGAPGWKDARGGGLGGYRFASEARASDAAARFIENLVSCKKHAWRTQPIAQTGGVLAYTTTGVTWIQQYDDRVEVLQVPTTDGPPPPDVQAEVAEWMVAYITLMNEPVD